MITFLHGAKFIRILKRRCTVCRQKKLNNGHNFDMSKDTPTELHRVCRRCESELLRAAALLAGKK